MDTESLTSSEYGEPLVIDEDEEDYEDLDFISRLFKAPVSCQDVLSEFVDFLKENEYGDRLSRCVEYGIKVGIKSQEPIYICSTALMLINKEKTIKKMLIETFYNDSSTYTKEFVEIFLKCLECRTLDLLSSSFVKTNAKEYLTEYVNYLRHAWLTKNINTLKKGCTFRDEISNKATGCNISE